MNYIKIALFFICLSKGLASAEYVLFTKICEDMLVSFVTFTDCHRVGTTRTGPTCYGGNGNESH